MKKKEINGLKIASKTLVAIGAACGLAAIFCPPVAIASATLSAVAGALELAEVVKKNKANKVKTKQRTLTENSSETSSTSTERSLTSEEVPVLNLSATKDNVKRIQKRRSRNMGRELAS